MEDEEEDGACFQFGMLNKSYCHVVQEGGRVPRLPLNEDSPEGGGCPLKGEEASGAAEGAIMVRILPERKAAKILLLTAEAEVQRQG